MFTVLPAAVSSSYKEAHEKNNRASAPTREMGGGGLQNPPEELLMTQEQRTCVFALEEIAERGVPAKHRPPMKERKALRRYFVATFSAKLLSRITHGRVTSALNWTTSVPMRFDLVQQQNRDGLENRVQKVVSAMKQTAAVPLKGLKALYHFYISWMLISAPSRIVL